MHRSLRVASLIVPLVVLGSASENPARYRAEPYLDDLRALEDSTAVGYANLEWQVRAGVVDPQTLHRRTETLIREARSGSEAEAALIAFGEAFKDGHYRVRRPKSRAMRWFSSLGSGGGDAPPAISGGAARACSALGYVRHRASSVLANARGHRALGPADAPFPAGIIERDGERIGVLKIASFGTDQFRRECERAWPAAAVEDSSGRCGSRCARRLWFATSDTLLAELRHAIGRVKSAGATVLIVDLAGNGGGTDWVTPAARQFTTSRLHGHTAGEIKHPHSERRWVSAIATIDQALKEANDAGWTSTLESARRRAQAQLNAIRAPCDRRAIWRDGIAALACSQVAQHVYTTGLVDYASPADRDRPAAKAVFGPARFRYAEGTWDGRLVLLVDGHTASASEDFVVTLKDHGAALVIGERTYGAGCGYTDGGIGYRLPHSGLTVAMPDCARIRRDGANEVSGIEVDVKVAIDAEAVLRQAAGPSRALLR